jgi:hypothetical protein
MGGGYLRDGCPVVPHIAGAQQGLKGGGLGVGGSGYPGKLWDQLRTGVWHGRGVVFQCGVDPEAGVWCG